MCPTRTCVACRKKNDKSNLERIVALSDIATWDKNQGLNSRGIYICRDVSCIKKLLKLLDKNKSKLKINVSTEGLREVLDNIGYELGE